MITRQLLLAATVFYAVVAAPAGARAAGSPEAAVTPEQAWKIGWPCLTGPYHTWAAMPSGLKLVDGWADLNDYVPSGTAMDEVERCLSIVCPTGNCQWEPNPI